ncbi:guanylate-binding protein 1-like [Sigmodon hispidus]
MSSEMPMPDAVCLIEDVKGQLIAKEEALRILSAIEQPVVVVAIVGLYPTGKSYLMNKLAGKDTGFSLGSTVQSHTKGIWMWCVPHPCKEDHTLVLLDTEGLGDVEKGNNQNDSWIFALSILLSSTFVYNSMGTINQQAIDQLHYVTELTDRIRIRSSPAQGEMEDSDEFVSFFPDFVWTLGDFSLELKINGKPISPDEYLENSLSLLHGTDELDKEKELNLPRLCIQKFFPKKKCFVFAGPINGKALGQLELIDDQDLESTFLEQVADFCFYVFNHSKVKTLSGGIKVNGPRLENLVITYVNTISSGGLLCMENAVLALSQTENAAAVLKAIALYDQRMSQKLQLPTETLRDLLDLHRASEKEAIKIFMENSFKDINQVFLTQLEATLETKQEEFIKKNIQASLDCCSALLQDIFSPLEEDVKQGVYSKPGGYPHFLRKIQELKKKYYEKPGKGIQAEEALQKYLHSKEEMSEVILQTDQNLTEKEKDIEVERVKAEATQTIAKMKEEMKQQNEQLLLQKEKTHPELMKQFTEEMEKVQAQTKEMQQQNEELLQQKEKFYKEGMKQLTEKLEQAQAQIREMQEQNEQLLQQKEKTHEVHMKQLTEKLEKAQAKIREMQEQYKLLLQQKEKAHEESKKQLTEKLGKSQVLIREIQQQNQQLLQQKEKNHKEHMKELTEKMEKSHAQMREIQQENEKFLEQQRNESMKQSSEVMEKAEAQMRETQKSNESLLQEKEKSHKEYIKHLTKKMEKIKDQMMAQQENFYREKRISLITGAVHFQGEK